jgi:Protein of unknown function (DUF1292).
MEKIVFVSDEEEIELYIIEQTRVQGADYLLVTDSDEEDSECYILKDTSNADEEEADYIFVEDEKELDALMKVFTELLEDVKIEKL